MSTYVESGYVNSGYVEGDTVTFDIGSGAISLKHFISTGAVSEEDVISGIRDSITTNEVGLLYMPITGKILLVSQNSIATFLGGVGDMIVQMKAPDGTVIATPDVVRDGTTFTYTIPASMSDTEYSVSIDISTCDGC